MKQWLQLTTLIYSYIILKVIPKPGDDAWYNISSEFLTFSGITVWQTDNILKNSKIYSCVECSFKFCTKIK